MFQGYLNGITRDLFKIMTTVPDLYHVADSVLLKSYTSIRTLSNHENMNLILLYQNVSKQAKI